MDVLSVSETYPYATIPPPGHTLTVSDCYLEYGLSYYQTYVRTLLSEQLMGAEGREEPDAVW